MKLELTPEQQDVADRLESRMLDVVLAALAALAFLAWILALMAQARSHHRERKQQRKVLKHNQDPDLSS